ncbi:type 2 isopentenyl-diphosphate Delta-isomerase [Facklamia sp. DSM 111018]|uniref:Isopentenyl-diphosphate delta-isomerase n=1 Tax=Facklamia lactis TaxID=2749967 RepID=A0ABS0LSE7_9LACT|nr:type 2 isopentenyl-diphosphate Delta-isomerase [Facklamia lactis]MBG9986385.1 type 2 isopentenyl-diphosphate Delta-isomerase [Facklamia lactis]
MTQFKSQDPSLSQQRKADHIRLALDQQNDIKVNPFDQIRFVHHSLANIRLEEIDLSTSWANSYHPFPFYINGMTGGHTQSKEYNYRLAVVARETGLAMGVGSVSAALSDPTVKETYTIIREANPQGFILANLGAHHGLENAQKAVDLLQANALQIHLNLPQEVVMPEGDRDFRSWAKNIEEIVNGLSVPVIIKEVGFGMSQETIQKLIHLGVHTIDISGRGGTNFVHIENDRRDTLDFSDLGSWGQTTPESLLEASHHLHEVEILASGGIRHSLDIVKSLALGARSAGIAGKFLHSVAHEGIDPTIQLVNQWKTAIQHMMLLLNCKSIHDLQATDIVLTHSLLDWAKSRQIDFQTLANRSKKELDNSND